MGYGCRRVGGERVPLMHNEKQNWKKEARKNIEKFNDDDSISNLFTGLQIVRETVSGETFDLKRGL